MKPQPEYRENEAVPGSYGTFFHGWNLDHSAVIIGDILRYCPYGNSRHRLWVQESFRVNSSIPWTEGPLATVVYNADNSRRDHIVIPRSHVDKPSSRIRTSFLSGRFMPRWASRILLEVKDIRVERIQEIAASPEDMLAEGVTAVTEAAEHLAFEFRGLWDSINAKRRFGWDVNPWVWVVEFRRIDNGK